MIISFYKGIVKDERLHTLMRYMLGMSNFINGDHKKRGGRWGFKFESLELAATIPTVIDTKKSMVQTMIDMIEDGGKKGSIIDPNEEFEELDYV